MFRHVRRKDADVEIMTGVRSPNIRRPSFGLSMEILRVFLKVRPMADDR